ncbi:glycerol-3-phosphate dehydrogenase, partial [Oharaeibacter diazotrophicus]
RRTVVRARVLVNAAGPWAGDVAARVVGRPAAGKVRMVQGSHLVTRKLYDHDRCFIFQNPDGRIIFTIPYERDFTLVGTTDRDYDGDLGAVRISEGETDYLLKAASAYFRTPVGRGDVVWSYSGVRPLYDDGKGAAQKATRDYVLETDDGAGAPMLSIFGGKITTYRRLAEAAMEKIAAMLPAATAGAVRAKAGWTGRAALPGGDFPKEEFGRRVTALKSAYPFLAADQAERLTRCYGTEAPRVLGDARKAADLGRAFGAGLTEAEVEWMRREEWARDAETILWRRTKLGLRLGRDQIEDLGRRMGEIGRAA